MGGGRRWFLPADATDPERGHNTAHGRLDGRNLIDVSEVQKTVYKTRKKLFIRKKFKMVEI